MLGRAFGGKQPLGIHDAERSSLLWDVKDRG